MGVNRSNTDQYQLRLPAGLRERIKEAADINGRSMNTEIVERLEESLDGRMPSSEAQNMIRDLQGKLAIMTTMANVRLETIEAFIRLLAPSDEARDEIWNAIRSGKLDAFKSLKEI